MALDCDDEILQDFLIESSEILEQLSQELLTLEANKDDMNILNSIFRGFHTIKGGAGFLGIGPLVDVCHISENVFDILRQKRRQVDAELMDIILRSLDTINDIFAEIRNGEEPSPAPQDLLDDLSRMAIPGAPPSEASVSSDPEPSSVAMNIPTSPVADQSSDVEITDSEFEDLLDAINGDLSNEPVSKQSTPAKTPVPPPPAASETPPASVAAVTTGADISDDEIDAFLESQLGSAPASPPQPKVEAKPKTATSAESHKDISEDEFENLLGSLHTPGTASVKASHPTPPSAPSTIREVEIKSPTRDKAAALNKPSDSPARQTKAPPKAKDHSAPTAEQTLRVDTARLDDIMNMVGELVLVRNRLVTLGGKSQDDVMAKAVANLDVVTADLQMAVMKTRMQPIKKVFGRFPRVVRDLSRSLQKDIVLNMEGEETDLDKNLVEALADPLVHLVRNSVDHGVEMPDIRVKSGKSKTGTITLSAEQAGDHILLNITDDGGGMNANYLKEKAVERGLMEEDAAARLSDKEAFNLIFQPGFSTKTEISDISGRGVGMDVVKTKITQLNGTIDIDSHLGKGTKISIKVPLTLAILPTLMVVIGKQTFALPLTSVSEIFNLDLTNTNIVDGQLVIIVRDKAVPLFYLVDWLVKPGIYDPRVNPEEQHVVIVTIGTQKVGFVVNGLLGQEEVVIKPLGDMLQGTHGLAGATITGDGHIALILDVPGLLKGYARKNAMS